MKMLNPQWLSQVIKNISLSPTKTVLAVLITNILLNPAYAACSGTTDIECNGVLSGNLVYSNAGIDTLKLIDVSLPGFVDLSENSGHATFLTLLNSSISSGGVTAVVLENTNGGEIDITMDKPSVIVSTLGGSMPRVPRLVILQ